MKKVLLSLFVLICTCNKTDGPDIAGSGSRAGNAMVSGTLYNTDRTVASGATVLFVPVNYNPQTGTAVEIDSTETDETGNYSMDSLAYGDYNIIGKKNGLFSFRDSLPIREGLPLKVPSDTLKQPGAIKGIVKLNPGHDSRSVFVIAIGTDRMISCIDSLGHFQLNYLPAGNHVVRFIATMYDYAILDTEINVAAGRVGELGDTIRLVYRGIPVPVGLKAVYDLKTGDVRLSWNRISGPQIAGYVLYRNVVGAQTPARVNSTLITDTFYTERIYSYSSDSNWYDFEYRLKVQDNNYNLSLSYSQPAVVTTCPPWGVRTQLGLAVWPSSLVFTGENMTVVASYRNLEMPISQVEWFAHLDSGAVRIHQETSNYGKDSMTFQWSKGSIQWIKVVVTDSAGRKLEDTSMVVIVDSIASSVNRLVLIQGGSFTDVEGKKATVSGLYLQQSEVTLRDFNKFDSAHVNTSTKSPCPFEPVETVTFIQALRYANWLSKNEGYDTCYLMDTTKTVDGRNWGEKTYWTCDFTKNGYRLPTGDEWEYAAKCGLNLDYSTADGTLGLYMANTAMLYIGHVLPVKIFGANPFNLYDMTGNAWEWVWEGTEGVWGNPMSKPADRIDFHALPDDVNRGFNVKRGSSFIAYLGSLDAKVTIAYSYDNGYFKTDHGFRLCRNGK